MTKKNIMMVLILIATSAPLVAHCGSCGVGKSSAKPSHKYHQTIDQLNTELGLSDDQVTAIEKIMKKEKKAIYKIKKRARKSIETQLNDDQKKQYKRMMRQKESSCDVCDS